MRARHLVRDVRGMFLHTRQFCSQVVFVQLWGSAQHAHTTGTCTFWTSSPCDDVIAIALFFWLPPAVSRHPFPTSNYPIAAVRFQHDHSPVCHCIHSLGRALSLKALLSARPLHLPLIALYCSSPLHLRLHPPLSSLTTRRPRYYPLACS